MTSQGSGFRVGRSAVVVFAGALIVATLGPARAAETRNFLWKATGRQGVVYLVGSVHLLTKDFYPLSAAVETAYKQSDLLVEEVDIAELDAPNAQMQMLQRAMLPGEQSLEKVLSPATYALVSRRFGDIGMPIEAVKRLKPWMVALMLESLEWQKAGFTAEFGLDKH